MKLTHLSPERAALAALGLGPTTNSSFEARVRCREALQKRNLAPFRMGTVTVQFTVTAMAALNLIRHFNGIAVPWVGVDSEEGLFDGFHRRAPEGDLFHSDSGDFEDRYVALEEQCHALSVDLQEAGVNIPQSYEPRTLGEPTSLVMSGTLMDWWELRRAVGTGRSGAHPNVARVIEIVWSDLALQYPILTAALLEVQP